MSKEEVSICKIINHHHVYYVPTRRVQKRVSEKDEGREINEKLNLLMESISFHPSLWSFVHSYAKAAVAATMRLFSLSSTYFNASMVSNGNFLLLKIKSQNK